MFEHVLAEHTPTGLRPCITNDYEVDFATRVESKVELIQVCVDLHAKAETPEIRSLIHAAKEFGLTEGIVVTPDLNKEWVVDGIRFGQSQSINSSAIKILICKLDLFHSE